jgi:hypothetical protein|tara:strand:- start:391 stop:600 length:210 start_codon:yes stop_codon:yes gene_type:complete
MDHKSKSIIGKPELTGQVGESAVWDGPLNTDGFPKGKGNSRGITGMKLHHAGVPYKPLNAVLCAQGKEY